MGLQSKYTVTGGYAVQNALATLTAAASFGRGSEPGGNISFSDGTGAGQANQYYSKDFSIATLSYLDIDLKGGGGELDVLNVAMAMTAVKWVYVELDTPASGTSIRFGPQGRTNAAQLWFQAVTANFWEECLDIIMHSDPRSGWALGASTKVISLYNPGLATVTGKLRVIGTK